MRILGLWRESCGRGTWPLSDGGQEGHWLVLRTGPAWDPVVLVESVSHQEGRAAVQLWAARVDSLPCFL